MAVNFSELAKSLRSDMQELLDRADGARGEAGGLLDAAKAAEENLVDRERQQRKEQLERERAERLAELLNSDKDLAVHVGGEEEPVPAPESKPAPVVETKSEPAAEVKPAPVVEAKPAPVAEPASAPVVEAKSEPAVEVKPAPVIEVKSEPAAEVKPAPVAEVKPAPVAEPVSVPVAEAKPEPVEIVKPAVIEDAAPKADVNTAAPAQRPPRTERAPRSERDTADARPARTDRAPSGADRPPRVDRPGAYDRALRDERAKAGTSDAAFRPQSSYAPRTDRPAGGYAPRTQGGYAPRTDRPAGSGYAPRTQGGYAPRTDRPAGGGYAPRTQGGYAPRTDRPAGSGYAPRTDRPAGSGYAPRTQSGERAVVINPSAADRSRSFDPTKSAPKTYDKDKKSKNKKSTQKEAAPAVRWDDDSPMGTRNKSKHKIVTVRRPEPVIVDHAIITTETISVKDLSEKLGKPAAELIKKLFLLGVMATVNQEIDFDTCELLAADYGIAVEQQLTKTFEDVLADTAEDSDSDEQLKPRPPVVTIMGHVDHGKTSLLDAIRNSHVTEGEAGGITQHIGAYTVTCQGQPITFIDTPGHEAFTSMRARGAQVTDVVILVVAADDGIMPQTIEAIHHAKAANVPIVVAINKIDRPEADPERVKQQLTEYGLVSEDWGGDTICVPVSAKKQINLDKLLEMVLLQAEVLELRANPDRLAKGTIIEAKLDKARGPVATVLVQNGTLKKGDTIVAGTSYGRVRALVDDKRRFVASAGPSIPVEVLGFNSVPASGDILNAVPADKLSRQVAEERIDRFKAEQVKAQQKVSLDDLFAQMAEGELKDLNVIVKADVQGSVEAVKQALEKLSNDEVRVRCIHGGVGAITATDIMFASASNAIVIGFNVRPDSTAKQAVEREKVDMRLYRVIYNAIEDVQNAMKGMFKPVLKEVELGHASVRSTFRVSGVGTIAGAYVQDGKITRSAQVRVVRGGIVVYDGKIGSLKRFKDDVKEVASGYECGISLENFNDIEEGDSIEAFEMEEVERQ